MSDRTKILEAKSRLPMTALLDRLAPEWRKKNPIRADDKRNSFGADDNGWHDHGPGGLKGDQITFLERFEELSRGDAIRRFMELAGIETTARNNGQAPKPKPVNIDWPACVAAFTATKAQELADWRGYSLPFVQWLKAQKLIGIYQGQFALPLHDDAGNVCGVHHKTATAWATRGSTRPLVIGDRMAKKWIVFESQWDAFAVMQSLDYHLDGYEPSYAVLVTRGADNGKFAGIVPAEAEAIIVMQNDEEKNGKVASDDWLETIKADCPARLKIARPPVEVKDCNDWLRRGDSDFNRMIAEAEKVKWSGLSCRSPGELLAMQFDDGDKILGDRLLAEGSSLSILGAGGIGKSRMLMQLAACQILGVPFLNFPTHGTPKKWLIIQSENSNRRLRFDLERLKAWCGSRWSEVEPLLFFHTVESEEDSLLQIEDPEALARLEALIKRISADVVAFDPLNAFSADDLNKDMVMKSVLTALGTVARRGNPRRALLIIHHALTGKAGKTKAMGHDRSSFGRNSKVLFAWTRAQINVVATREDSNDQLVFACGKNNDGAEFQPFAAVLGHDMIYMPDPNFDLTAWQEEIGSSTARAVEPTCKPETVVEILAAAPLAKAALVKAIKEESGCEKTRAYEVIDQAQTLKLIRFDKSTRKLHAA